jgi:hypothetical protein
VDRARTTKLALNTLIGVRLSFGVASWFAPGPVGKVLGLEVNGQVPYLARVFGVRDAVLALGAYSSSGEARRQWLLAGLVSDGADAVASIIGGRSGYMSARASVGLTVFALSGVSLATAILSVGQHGSEQSERSPALP